MRMRHANIQVSALAATTSGHHDSTLHVAASTLLDRWIVSP